MSSFVHWRGGKGGTYLSLPQYGVKTRLGQLHGREGAPRCCSHFNVSYSPKPLRQKTSSTNPFHSMKVRPDQRKANQTKANHLALTLLPNLWCPCTEHVAFSSGRLQNNQTPFGQGEARAMAVLQPLSLHSKKNKEGSKQLVSKTSCLSHQYFKWKHIVRPVLFCVSLNLKSYKNPYT